MFEAAAAGASISERFDAMVSMDAAGVAAAMDAMCRDYELQAIVSFDRVERAAAAFMRDPCPELLRFAAFLDGLDGIRGQWLAGAGGDVTDDPVAEAFVAGLYDIMVSVLRETMDGNRYFRLVLVVDLVHKFATGGRAAGPREYADAIARALVKHKTVSWRLFSDLFGPTVRLLAQRGDLEEAKLVCRAAAARMVSGRAWAAAGENAASAAGEKADADADAADDMRVFKALVCVEHLHAGAAGCVAWKHSLPLACAECAGPGRAAAARRVMDCYRRYLAQEPREPREPREP